MKDAASATRDVGPLVLRVAERLAQWHDRRAGRRRPMMLDGRMLKDIGLDRAAAEEEYRKPFWRWGTVSGREER